MDSFVLVKLKITNFWHLFHSIYKYSSLQVILTHGEYGTF